MKFSLEQLWIFPAILFALFIILGANAHNLWVDEAETSFFAKSVLKNGIPFGFDGTNVSSISLAFLLDENLINHISPPLQFYLTALSFKLFGISSITARLPFILFGILTIGLIYLLSLKLFDKQSAFLSVLMASLNLPLILYSFQARYYSLIFVFGLLMVYATYGLAFKKLWPRLLFILSAALYLYSHLLSFVVFSASLFLTGSLFIFLKQKNWKAVIKFDLEFLLLVFLAFLVYSPWFFHFKPLEGTGGFVWHDLSSFIRLLQERLISLFNTFSSNGVFPLILFPVICFGLFMQAKNKRGANYIFIVLCPLIYFVLMAHFAAITDSPIFAPTEERYNIIVIPLFIIALSATFKIIWQWNRYLATALIILYLTNNLLTFQRPEILLLSYIGEITHPFPTADKIVADYLNSHASDGDLVFINYDRAHDPVIFLLNKKIRFINRVSPANPKLFPKNLTVLPKYIYADLIPSEWVIMYSNHHQNLDSFFDFDIREKFPLGLPSSVNLQRDYTLTTLPVFYNSDIIRPELSFHKFSPPYPKEHEKIFIYQRK